MQLGDKPTIRQRLRYRFDQSMARGISALVGYLAVATLLLIGLFVAVVMIGGFAPESQTGDRPGLIRQIFNNTLHAIDPGTVANDNGKWPFLLAMLLLTLGGLMIVSALIGVLANGLDNRLEELRKGRSFVIESNHTLILGWSDTIFTILSELVIANASEKDPVVVILANKDKVEMEDAIRDKVRHLDGTRVVCRSGHPIDLTDLHIANPLQARSIVVLAPEDEADADSQVIKVLLALLRGPMSRACNGNPPYKIVAEIQDPSNMEAARLVGRDDAVLIDKSETIARLLAHSSRQAGISIVYTELLDFDGDEVYFRADPALVGKTFGEALFAYADCCVIGLAFGDGTMKVNPPMDRVIAAEDKLIAIAEDDTALNAAVEVTAPVEEGAIVAEPRRPPSPQRCLLLGWNHRGTHVIRELDGYLTDGSEVHVANEIAASGAEVERLQGELKSLTVTHEQANTTDRAVLEGLDPVSFDSAIVLCYSDDYDHQSADARTLVTLLHLRDISDKADAGPDGGVSIVSEMLDDRNRELAEVTHVNDVIVSDKVISLMLAQLAENAALNAVFSDMFQVDGSEIYLRGAEHYATAGAEVSFATLVEAARRRDEVAIGYSHGALRDDAASGYGVVVNPPKAERFTVAAGDRVVVLAED
jgi:voltage-gated potassium channel Kch